MSNYDRQATDFLEKTGSKISIKFKIHAPHFPDDTSPRDIYDVTLSRNARGYSFTFGQSIWNSGYYMDPVTKEKYSCDLTRRSDNRKVTRSHIDSCCRRVLLGKVKPTAYDILSCLSPQDPGSFENFREDFGYDTDSRQAESTYHAVRKEAEGLARLYSDNELEALGEIC